MRKRNCLPVLMFAVFALLVLPASAPGAAEATWRAEEIAVLEGFSVPESVRPDPEKGMAYVTSIEAGEGKYWEDDGEGFVSTITALGEVEKPRWLDSTPERPIHSPKGASLLKGYLYFTDNTRLLRVKMSGGPVEEVPLPHTVQLNDTATDGRYVYVSDMGLGKVYKVGAQGGQTLIRAPESVNGVACHRGRLFAVSWGAHEVYELDPAGDLDPRPFGLAGEFTTLDGIEVLADGTLLVSDFEGNKVCTIEPGGKTVRTLLEAETPADIGVDEVRGILYVPLFMKNQVALYKLSKE